MADLKYTADFSQIAKEVRKNRKDLNDWATAVSDDLQKVNRNMTLVGKTSTLALNNIGKSMNRMGVLTQQAGYQIGDFIVQVQSGTNAFVAFGQQATQVAGTLTLLGGKWIAIGTALGIAIPLFTAVAAAVMRTRQESEGAAKGIVTYKEALEKAQKAQRDLNDEIDRTVRGFKDQTEQILSDAVVKAQEEVIRREKILAEARGVAKKGAMDNLEAARKGHEDAKKALEEYQDTLVRGEAKEAHEEYLKNIRSLRSEIGEAASTMLVMAGVNIGKPVSDALKEAAVLADKMDISLEQAIKFNATNMSAGVSAAAKAAAELAKQMNISLRAAMGMMGMIERGPGFAGDAGDPRYAGTDSPEQALARRVARIRELMENPPTFDSPSGRGGGGGGAAAGDRIGALAQSLATEGELLEMWYQDSLVKLQEFNAKELELLGGHAQARERIEQEHQNRMAAIEQAAKQQRLSETAGLFGALASIAATGGKKMAKAAATFEAIQGVINAYGAAIKALNTPGISLPARFAAYASVLAAGLRGVAAIRQAGGVGGGGGGGGGGGRIATPASAAASPQRVLIQGIGPNDLITGSQLSEIFDRLYEENENRGLVFQIAS